MHAKIAARRAWLDYERQQGLQTMVEQVQTTVTPHAKKTRARYVVQFGVKNTSYARMGEPIECRDASEAARLAANLCFCFIHGSPGTMHLPDYWILANTGRDVIEWQSLTQFVRLSRTYPLEV